MTENMSDDDIIIVKASFDLKMKAGSGGFAPELIKAAEKRMDEAKTLFPSIAAQDVEEIEEILLLLSNGDRSESLLQRIYAASIELKLNSEMFHYPLVAAVSDSLGRFCEITKTLSGLVSEVVALHLQTLKIAIQEGPRAITEKDRIELLSGLDKARQKALHTDK